MTVELLYIRGCPHHKGAKKQLMWVLKDLGIDAEVARIAITDQAMAERLRFPGSPTIRVNGVDVVDEGHDGPFSLQCRIYRTNEGFSGSPSQESIREALGQARLEPGDHG